MAPVFLYLFINIRFAVLMSIQLNSVNIDNRCLFGGHQDHKDINVPHTVEQGFSTALMSQEGSLRMCVCVQVVLYIAGCLTASLLSTSRFQQHPLNHNKQKCLQIFAKHPLVEKLHPVKNHCSRGLFWKLKASSEEVPSGTGQWEEDNRRFGVSYKKGFQRYNTELFFI